MIPRIAAIAVLMALTASHAWAWLRETGDPRATADDDRWDRFPYYGQPAK